MQLIDDRYELLEVIASGGMATVWRARDTRLNRLVAVKRPHPAPSGDDSAGRMAREARAAASLNHPNLITVHDFGSDASGPYLVMELVEGPTLDDIAGELDAEEVTDLGARLADALAAIHATGIVHRDIKPANVIMSERGPLLTDFGIALDPNATAEISQPGTVVATPSYAAPEVLDGAQPTPASDVYSLGVVIDELMRKTGAKPGTAGDHAIASALEVSPKERPTAADLANSFRGTAPAYSGIPSERTTMVLETPPLPPATMTTPADDSHRRAPSPLTWAVGILSLLVVALIAVGMTLSGDDPPADAAVAPTTIAAATSTTMSTTTTSTLTSSTVTSSGSLEERVSEARSELESVLTRPPRSDFKPPEVEDVMKKVDEAIEAAFEGKMDKAEEKLLESERRFEEKLGGDRLAEARRALNDLAELLGVELEEDDDD